MSRREIVDCLSEQAPCVYDDVALRYAAVPDVSWRPEYVRFARPPAACTNDVGYFVNFAERVEDVMTGYRRVAVVRVLLRLYRKHQMRILQKCDSAVVARVIRENLHVASDFGLERCSGEEL